MVSSHDAPIIYAFNLVKKKKKIQPVNSQKLNAEWGTYTPIRHFF